MRVRMSMMLTVRYADWIRTQPKRGMVNHHSASLLQLGPGRWCRLDISSLFSLSQSPLYTFRNVRMRVCRLMECR